MNAAQKSMLKRAKELEKEFDVNIYSDVVSVRSKRMIHITFTDADAVDIKEKAGIPIGAVLGSVFETPEQALLFFLDSAGALQ